MDETRREKLRELFDQATARPPLERQAFIDGACSGDDELRRELEDLLLAEGGAGEFLADPTVSVDSLSDALGSSLSPAPPGLSFPPGTRIGRYKLLQELGEGGFGIVYMAEQDEPIRRTVALKLIKLGMDTREVIARFEVERQALAMMDHPNIARVLDAGATASGRPYFVMELVRGVSITEYADVNQLGTGERLDLFVKVCSAVQHAHQKGVIHRDLKPSNILVTLHDGVPVPKVIDFGVAKATNARLTERTLFTRFRQLIGTPAYMSPEQAEMSGLDIDTRSDIYSLGVLLYELLTGTTPFDPQTLLEAGYAEIQRYIRDVEPERPSARISTMKEEGRTAVAKHRKCEPAALERSLRGELDWIVMKALEKDRTRRYGNALDLARDIERHVANEPVEAGPPSTAYRMRKLLRRNRAVVATAGGVIAALLVGFTLALFGFISAARESERATESEKEAVAEARTASKVVELVQGMFAAANPEMLKGKDYTVRQLLDDFTRNLAGELGDEPRVGIVLSLTIGEAYFGLGCYEEAQTHFGIALDLARKHYGDEHEITLSCMTDQAHLLLRTHRTQEAYALCVHVVEVRRRVLGRDDPRTLSSLHLLAPILGGVGRADEEEPLLLEVIEGFRRTVGEEDLRTVGALTDLGTRNMNRGRFREAGAIFEKCLKILSRIRGEEHPSSLQVRFYLAYVYQRTDRRKDAVSLLEQGIELSRHKRGTAGPTTWLGMSKLAALYVEEGRPKEAARLFEEVIASQRTMLGEDYPTTLVCMIGLSQAYGAAGAISKAESTARTALEGLQRTLGERDWATFYAMHVLSRQLTELERFTEAENFNQKALDGLRRVSGDDAEVTLDCMPSLAVLYLRSGRFAEAIPHLESLVARGHEAAWSGSLLEAAKRLVDAAGLFQSGKKREAIILLEEASQSNSAHELHTTLAAYRAQVAPNVLTCGSVDAALEHDEAIVPEGAPWRYFLGTEEPSSGLDWAQPELDDSAWLVGRSGFGVGDDDDATVLEELGRGVTSLYLRCAFDLGAPETIEGLTLLVKADDGFVAYWNGQEVGRDRAGASGERIAFDGTASSAVLEPLLPSRIELLRDVLKSGRKVLAIQGLNRDGSPDFSLIPTVMACYRGPWAGGRRRFASHLEKVQLDPSAVGAYLEGCLAFRAGEFDKAAAVYRRAVDLGGFSAVEPQPTVKLAKCLRKLGRAAEAEEVLRRALTDGLVASREAWELWLATLFEDLGREADEALRLAPQSATAAAADMRWLLERLAKAEAIRIDCGASEPYQSADGKEWAADRFSDGGNPGSKRSVRDARTSDATVLATELWFPPAGPGRSGYFVPLPRGRYRVTLHLVETYEKVTGPGQRVCDVLLEGKAVLSAYDAFAAVGFGVADPRSFVVEVKDGILDLGFLRRADNPSLKALEIESAGADDLPAEVPTGAR
jgi:serine/threonine protein kinase